MNWERRRDHWQCAWFCGTVLLPGIVGRVTKVHTKQLSSEFAKRHTSPDKTHPPLALQAMFTPGRRVVSCIACRLTPTDDIRICTEVDRLRARGRCRCADNTVTVCLLYVGWHSAVVRRLRLRWRSLTSSFVLPKPNSFVMSITSSSRILVGKCLLYKPSPQGTSTTARTRHV